jgi:hypothetical protein
VDQCVADLRLEGYAFVHKEHIGNGANLYQHWAGPVTANVAEVVHLDGLMLRSPPSPSVFRLGNFCYGSRGARGRGGEPYIAVYALISQYRTNYRAGAPDAQDLGLSRTQSEGIANGSMDILLVGVACLL